MEFYNFIKSLFSPIAPRFLKYSNNSKYVLFTTKYDEIIDGENIPKLLKKMSPEEEVNFKKACQQFVNGFTF